MEVVKITPRGYCHGVVDAIKIARQLGAEAGSEAVPQPVHMLGYLVHNEHVTDELKEHGVELVDEDDRFAGLQRIDDGTVIFTAHGVSPKVKEQAVAMGLRAVDATCSDVVRTHDLVKDLAGRGFHIFYIGQKKHPEPEGVIGEAPENVHLLEPLDFEALDHVDFPTEKLAVTCQTTLSQWDTISTIEEIQRRWPTVEVYNEICKATQERQEAAVEAAAHVDMVIVVGSSRSSNSKRLVQVVEELGHKPAHLVDSPSDIDDGWFAGVARVGVTSGASTPTWMTRKVIEYLERLGEPVPATST
ncbi:MAG TPA: 4-hydroxy-3-methylbut-2-enyl diphosphate reductase [Candidatus Solibacter sp.]|jgi:4-hydroxy-3-methylbut-2-enyl diphosphate reductase|nr:4-hydroxy-3-methylbut-2-enyl diphosphate reductase [Candidatus Solibacter sp.]